MPPKKSIPEMTARCMKCKASRQMEDPKQSKTSKGSNMLKGKCPECGTTMCRIVGGSFKL